MSQGGESTSWCRKPKSGRGSRLRRRHPARICADILASTSITCCKQSKGAISISCARHQPKNWFSSSRWSAEANSALICCGDGVTARPLTFLIYRDQQRACEHEYTAG